MLTYAVAAGALDARAHIHTDIHCMFVACQTAVLLTLLTLLQVKQRFGEFVPAVLLNLLTLLTLLQVKQRFGEFVPDLAALARQTQVCVRARVRVRVRMLTDADGC